MDPVNEVAPPLPVTGYPVLANEVWNLLGVGEKYPCL